MARYDDVEDAVGGIVQPDVLLPGQLSAGPATAQDPERRLLLAVLADGVRCFQRLVFATGARERQLFTEAEEWLESRDAAPFFSFENVCSVLDLDPASIRSGLRRWREAAEARQAASGQRDSGGTAGDVRPGVRRDDGEEQHRDVA